MAETAALLALALSSRGLISLRQSISDIYDAIAGKLKVCFWVVSLEVLSAPCNIPLSFCSGGSNDLSFFLELCCIQTGWTSPITIKQLMRERFCCQLELPQPRLLTVMIVSRICSIRLRYAALQGIHAVEQAIRKKACFLLYVSLSLLLSVSDIKSVKTASPSCHVSQCSVPIATQSTCLSWQNYYI